MDHLDFVLDRYYSVEFLRLQRRLFSGVDPTVIDCEFGPLSAPQGRKDAEFLMLALIEGGNISPNELVSAQVPLMFFACIQTRRSGGGGCWREAIRGGRLTDFAPYDNAFTDYLDGARFISFGEVTALLFNAPKAG